MKSLHWIALILVIIGALNWGLIGFFGFNLVAAIFGQGEWLSRAVYAVVGIAAVIVAFTATQFSEPTHRVHHHQEHRAV